MPNLGAGGTFSVDGLWLIPWNVNGIVSEDQAWIGAKSPEVTGEVQAEFISIDGRDEPIRDSSGVVELDTGVIDGALLDRNGQVGDVWLRRLNALVRNQENYVRIWLVTRRLLYKNVALGSLTASPEIIGGDGWKVSLPFAERRD